MSSPESSKSTEVVRWADKAMFEAEPVDETAGPRVYLLSMTPDPLGAIAAACLMYEGRVVRSLSEVSDDDRRKYLEQIQKTHLKAPFEFVQFHFMIEGVTRAFTHQMVRQRTAVYAQESMRFAVKDPLPVGLPPSLAGTEHASVGALDDEEWMHSRPSEAQQQRETWDHAVETISEAYNALVAAGMPAEDARGLLPTNTLTRLHYSTNLRGLLEHAGNRLCTQAQFEWRLVFSQIAKAIREYDPCTSPKNCSAWQFEALADLFRPICYMTGKCEFKASFDRSCSIRDRVDENHAHGRSSELWNQQLLDGIDGSIRIDPIRPVEWLADPTAARRS